MTLIWLALYAVGAIASLVFAAFGLWVSENPDEEE
jgi:acyl-coenzyme A synthetase/AMP-(fatty) acid ligase